MDTLAHALWTWLLYKLLAAKTATTINGKLAIFWGVFPDLFAFTVQSVLLLGNLALGRINFEDSLYLLTHLKTSDSLEERLPVFRLTLLLYAIGHSALVFFIIFTLTLIIFRRMQWELVAWLLHIGIDVITHSHKQFYAPAFLWPFSLWTLNGISWNTTWFFLGNYSAIVIAYFLVRKFVHPNEKRKQQKGCRY